MFFVWYDYCFSSKDLTGMVLVTEPTFSERTVTKPIPRSRHPVRRHATEPTFTEPIFFSKTSNFIKSCTSKGDTSKSLLR